MITLEKGQQVKCFMRNGMVLEGIIEENSTSQCVLKSLDGKSLMIVHRPVEDILLTKVVLEIPEENPVTEIPKEWVAEKTNLRDKLEEVLHPTGEPEADEMNLKQLRTLVIDQEKKIITRKRREHFGSAYTSGKAGKYSTPFTPYRPGKLPRK